MTRETPIAAERAGGPARSKRPARRRRAPVLSGLGVLLLLALPCSLAIGAVPAAPRQVMLALFDPAAADPTLATIVRDLRLPRILLAALIGGGLASAGAAFQGLFRNPLADPFAVGASGGAALGATLAITLGLGRGGLGFGPVAFAALLGALAAVALVYVIAEAGGAPAGSATLLLAGAALSTLLSAAVSLLLILREEPLHAVFAWLLGGLAGRGWPHLWSSLAPIALGCAWLLLQARPLDALACGDEVAQSLGLPLRRARAGVVAAASLATAAAVANAGIIGFVGLIAPHIARRLVGPAHLRLIPASALVGALLMVIADTFARSAAAPLEIPVGVVTALLGGPFFLYLLKRQAGGS